MAGLTRRWRAVLGLLMAAVVILAALLACYAVPAKTVSRAEVEPFDFTMTQNGSWYRAPAGEVCSTLSERNCTGSNFFAPPPSVTGSYLVGFVWYSDENQSVQFSFWDPFCWLGVPPHQNPAVLYSTAATHGSFAINSTGLVVCSLSEGQGTVRVPWWSEGPTFDYEGPGAVTVLGSLAYTESASVPLL